MRETDIQDIEIRLFVEAMRLRHGYDFSHYARASLRRRVLGLTTAFGVERVRDLLPRILDEPGFYPEVISRLTVSVSEMFRDPAEFRFLRERVIPVLHSYPMITVWQAGCANGEEVYSLAILLAEEGLYDRCRIYATDINDAALARAEEGVYALNTLREYEANYRNAGGKVSLDHYYQASYDFAIMDRDLRRNLVFAHHNLASDGVFCEVNLILCRNVLIYFDKDLQNRVLRLFRDSFARGGFLCLGTKESLAHFEVAADFREMEHNRRFFRFEPGPRGGHRGWP